MTRPVQSLVRRLPAMQLRSLTLERLGEVQREVRQVHKRLLMLEGRAAITVHSPAEQDEQFLAAAAAVGRRTKLDHDRLWILWQAVWNAAELELPILEAGSYRGGSAWFLARAARERLGRELPLDAIDTFEGHPEQSITARDHEYHGAGRFGETSYERVEEYLSEFELATVHKGEFSAVAPKLDRERYGLAHLDMDLYRPTRDALDFCARRLAPGGVVVVDDYGSPKCPGVGQAVEEFVGAERDFQRWHPHTEQAVLVRVAA